MIKHPHYDARELTGSGIGGLFSSYTEPKKPRERSLISLLVDGIMLSRTAVFSVSIERQKSANVGRKQGPVGEDIT